MQFFSQVRRFILCFLVCCPSNVITAPSDSTLATFRLQYDGTIQPPATFVPHNSLRRPKVGLALSGGGIRGLAQIGVLQVLEENQIPIDFIAGSSIGSIIGGLYAAGYCPKDLWNIVRNIEWDKILVDTPPRSSLFLGQKEEQARYLLQIRFQGFKPYIPQAVTPGQRLTSTLADLIMLATHSHVTNFDSLRVPLRIVTTDLASGQKVMLVRGNLVEAMRASIAIPLLFTPVEYRGMMLVDGGLVDNIPVAEVKAADVDVVIAVDTTSPLREPHDLNLPWKVADQVTSIMEVSHNQDMLATADVVISLSDEKRSSTDATDLDNLLKAGRLRAAQKLTDIKKALVKSISSNISLSTQDYLIDRIRYHGTGFPIEKLVPEVSLLEAPARISATEIYASLKNIYSSGFFSNVQGTLSTDSSGTLLTYELKPHPVLKGFKLSGNFCFSDSVLYYVFSSKVSWPINHYQAQLDLRSIIAKYRQKGYSLARIANVSFDRATGIVTINIDEGVIDQIELQGKQRTRDHVVLRELGMSSGTTFNLQAAKQGVLNIYATGLFETVSFNIENSATGRRKLVVKLKERPYEVARIGAHYDRERGSRGFIELAEQNLYGTSTKIVSHLEYGDRDQKYGLQIRADRLFHTYATFSLNIYHQRKKRFTYAGHHQVGEYLQASSGIVFSAGQQIKRLGTVSFESRIEGVYITPLSGRVYQTGSLDLRTVALRSVVDTRDQLPFPTSGKHHIFYYEYAYGSFLTRGVSYFKVFSSLESWNTFYQYHTFHPRLTWGSCDNTAPFSEQFRLGGQNSFLGLRHEELVGRHLIVGGIEYRFLVPLEFPASTYLSVKYDIGAVWRTVLDVKPKDFIHSIGFFITFSTPVGPLSFAYGNVSDGRSRFYFSAGYNF